MHQIFQHLNDWYSNALQTGSYPAIALMMAVESSIFPLPSEIVIPPAAHWAHTGKIGLSLWGIVLAGTIGSWLGATVMYWVSRLAGRPLVLRWGQLIFAEPEMTQRQANWIVFLYGLLGILILWLKRYIGILISPKKIEETERWVAHYGSMGIFISRLLPVVRHLIGIPAGIVRMNYWIFSLYTLLGSAIWCSVLCYVGIKAGQDTDLMKGGYHRLSLWLAGAMLVLGGLYYFFVHRHMKGIKKAE